MREFLYEGNLLDYIATSRTLEDAMRQAGGERPDYLASLYTYCRNLLPNGALVVELGTYLAESTIIMGQALKQKGGRLITVDPVFLKGEYRAPDAHNKEGNLYEASLSDFYRKLKANKLYAHVSVIPGFSDVVLQYWDCPIDAILIDAEHTYDAVRRDCGWLKWIKPGGYAFIDDRFADIECAVKDFIYGDPQYLILHESTQQKTEQYCVTLLHKRESY